MSIRIAETAEVLALITKENHRHTKGLIINYQVTLITQQKEAEADQERMNTKRDIHHNK